MGVPWPTNKPTKQSPVDWENSILWDWVLQVACVKLVLSGGIYCFGCYQVVIVAWRLHWRHGCFANTCQLLAKWDTEKCKLEIETICLYSKSFTIWNVLFATGSFYFQVFFPVAPLNFTTVQRVVFSDESAFFMLNQGQPLEFCCKCKKKKLKQVFSAGLSLQLISLNTSHHLPATSWIRILPNLLEVAKG